MHRSSRRFPRRRRGRALSALALVVVGWWLIVGAMTTWVLPEPSASASDGETARIHQPGMDYWPVPTSRAGFDTFQRGIRESNEAAMDEAFVVSEWIHARHGQAVRIIAVDGEAIQVELLEGSYVGRRAWLKARNLRPGP